MSDLIDRAEAQTALQFAAKRYTLSSESGCEGHVLWSYPLISVTDAMNALRKLPSAQPEPKTGKWNFVGDQMFECMNCGTSYTEYQFEKMRVRYNDPKFPRFCPNCGSYNGGDSNEQT